MTFTRSEERTNVLETIEAKLRSMELVVDTDDFCYGFNVAVKEMQDFVAGMKKRG